jgi:hypothetical protein
MPRQEIMYSWNVVNPPRTKTIGGWFSADDPQSTGKQILTQYFEVAKNFPAFGYTDYDAWMTAQNVIIPDFEAFVGGLVISNSASTTIGQAGSRLESLADQSGGTAKQWQIVSAAGKGVGDSVNWAAGIPAIAADTALDTLKYATTVAQNVGTGVMGTLSLVKYLPWILGIGAAVYFLPQLMVAKRLVMGNPISKKYRSRLAYETRRLAVRGHSIEEASRLAREYLKEKRKSDRPRLKEYKNRK